MDEQQMREAMASANAQIDEMIRSMNAKAVFGEPIQQGDATLIPVASVTFGFGSGQGWGRGARTPEQAAETAQTVESGGGGGGGGGGRAHPMGYIRIDASGARWEPLMDMTRMSMGGMFLAGWIVFWMMKTAREGIKLAGRKLG